MPRQVARASRAYLEHKFSQGYSPRAVREAHNYLAGHRQREPFPLEKTVFRHRALSKKDVTRAYDRWRTAARRRPGSAEAQQFIERKTRIQEKVARYREALSYESVTGHIPPEPLKAADAGMLYRLTHDERYRERFEEGSP